MCSGSVLNQNDPLEIEIGPISANVCHDVKMKKQASDQLAHERRYQERKRAEASRKPIKKTVGGPATTVPESAASERPAKP